MGLFWLIRPHSIGETESISVFVTGLYFNLIFQMNSDRKPESCGIIVF